MLGRLAAWAARRAWAVLFVCACAAVAGGLLGRGLFGRLGYAVFRDPAAESTRGADLARSLFGEGDPDIVALYRLPEGTRPEDLPMQATLDRVAKDPQVARVLGAAGPFGQRFISRDRKSVMAVVSLRGSPSEKALALPRLRALLEVGTLQPLLGGLVPAGRSLTRLAEQSLVRGEKIALPMVAVLLVLLFGSVIAALLPVAIGGLAVVLALGALDLLARVLPIDAFAVNVVTILGLGVAIDYALFIVTRYRDETNEGNGGRPPALVRAANTAGRSVLFSGVTVAASLSGLLVFRQPFLRSIAVGGMVVTLLAAALALVVLPAMLALLGPHLERGSLPIHYDRRGRFWRRMTTQVIRRRRFVCIAGTLLLLFLGLPFRRLEPSRADVRALPENQEPRMVSDRLQSDFESASMTPDNLLVDLGGPATERLGELFDHQQRIAALPGVNKVESLLSYAGVHDRDHAEALGDRLASAPPQLKTILRDRYTLVRVLSTAPPDSRLSQQRIDALRAVAPPPGGHVLVYGQAASLHDFAESVRARSPWMLAWVALAMFAVLYAAFRSAILPIKAILMTTLSLTASFGAIVFVFQDGRFQRLLGYHTLGTTDATLPVVLFAVVFGLSMDYEVLILSRVREAYLRTGHNNDAIIEGIARTGRLVTGAAMIMVVVFSAFAVAPLIFVKALGLGMALAVALDATVVRMLLVPSTMALLGKLNWWTPRLRT